jgi:hypothetical protein
MRLFYSNKVLRLFLSAVVSIWMAGGCLFGCSSAMAAVTEGVTAAVQNAESCHAKRSHDCCSTAKPKKQVASNLKLLEGVASFIPAPLGMMRDCPLVIGSTAATSKNSTHVPDPGRASVAALPSFEKQTELTDNTVVRPFLPDRGPTHLRCCVFLI